MGHSGRYADEYKIFNPKTFLGYVGTSYMAEVVKEVFCKNVRELFENLTIWSSPYRLERYIFRGHSDSSFKLIPSALRIENKQRLWSVAGLDMPVNSQADWEIFQQQVEWEALRRFYRLADQNGLLLPVVEKYRARLNMEWDPATFHLVQFDQWIPNELLELAGLAQHYGIPTRLLDWTYDPMTACYFAAHGQISQSGKLDIWALNHEWLSFIGATVDATNLKFVTPPYFGNPNLAAQRGLFSIWPGKFLKITQAMSDIYFSSELSNAFSMDWCLRNHFLSTGKGPDQNILIRFSLPETERNRLKSDLLKMNYGKSRLFPGYAGVVAQLYQSGEIYNYSKFID